MNFATREAFLKYASIRQRCIEKLKREHPEMGMLDRKNKAQRVMHEELVDNLALTFLSESEPDYAERLAEETAQLALFNAWRDMGCPVPE